MKKTTLFGLIVTFLWFLFIGYLFCSSKQDFFSLELNAKGDFLAGVFAPVAFLWLVLGYFQQGKELSQNTDALLLQQKELEAQVKATIELGRHAERQAGSIEKTSREQVEEIRRNAAISLEEKGPVFSIRLGGIFDDVDSNFRMVNSGHAVQDCIVTSDAYVVESEAVDVLHRSGEQLFTIKDFVGGYPIDVTVSYKTFYGERHKDVLRLINHSSSHRIARC